MESHLATPTVHSSLNDLNKDPATGSPDDSIDYDDAYTRPASLTGVLPEKDTSAYAPPPDSGYGWVVVACSFLLEFFAEGPLSAFGVFQDYYVNDRFKGRVSNATISLVGVLSASSMATLGVVSGKLCEKYGYRIVPLCGTLLLSMGYFLASFATEPWHLLLTQGILCGIGAALTFMPAVVVPAQWFERRRGRATGIVNLGIGVGGLVWTQFNHLLIKKVSVAWTLRLTAIVVLITCSAAVILIRTYQTTPIKKKVDMKALGDKNLMLFLGGAFLTGIGSLIPFYYLPAYTGEIGLTDSNGATVASVANAASLTGRFLATVVSDMLGPVKILLVASFLTSSSILLVWTSAHNYVITLVFGLIFGLGYGATFTQTSAFVARLFGVDSLPVFVGLYYTMSGIGYLFGPPVAGVILERAGSWGSPYTALKLYSGIPLTLAFVAVIAILVNTNRKRIV